jgi:hypothetical protein
MPNETPKKQSGHGSATTLPRGPMPREMTPPDMKRDGQRLPADRPEEGLQRESSNRPSDEEETEREMRDRRAASPPPPSESQ